MKCPGTSFGPTEIQQESQQRADSGPEVGQQRAGGEPKESHQWADGEEEQGFRHAATTGPWPAAGQPQAHQYPAASLPPPRRPTTAAAAVAACSGPAPHTHERSEEMMQ
ncbi:hypothetical protein CRUP_038562 [Coryphaenoides rupestris]|nr:hypothetical protein CRUP_038562 [Coryphaenoides rupestris]